MVTINYESDHFPSSPANGPAILNSGSLSVHPARLAWAAATVAYSPYGPSANRRISPLEIQWRTAMVRTSLISRGGPFRRSTSYARLDSSEKGALSFFLGQAQAKLFAHELFRISRFVHYDKYLQHIGKPRSKTRPDFIGFRGDGTAIAVEAKGRSGMWDDQLVESAKEQVKALPSIAGYSDPIRYAHIAFFQRGEWTARLIDPPSHLNLLPADPAQLTVTYYEGIVAGTIGIGTGFELEEREDGNTYRRATFPGVDASILIRADIASLTEESLREQPNTREAKRPRIASLLYELALEVDSSASDVDMQESAPSGPSWRDNESFFLGGDGVGIELGSSWGGWA